MNLQTVTWIPFRQLPILTNTLPIVIGNPNPHIRDHTGMLKYWQDCFMLVSQYLFDFLPSCSDSVIQEFKSKVPKFANKYEEMLQPLSPVTTLPCEVVSPRPSRGHGIARDEKLQTEFNTVIESRDVEKVEVFLAKHSTEINVNQYNEEGRTSLQQCCVEGNLALVKVLVKYGADHLITTREGYPTVHLATFANNSDLLMYILNLRKLSSST